MANTINCSVCGKLTDSRLDSCPHCGAYLRRRSKPAAPTAGSASASKTCPQCKAVVDAGDIICVACGTNLLTGHKVAAEVAAASSARRASTGWMIGGSIAAVFVIVIGALALYAASSNPVKKALRLIDEGKFLEAEDILAGYVEGEPDDAPAWFELGKLRWNKGDSDGAAKAFAQAAELRPTDQDAALWAVVAFSQSSSADSQRRQLDLLTRVAEARPNDVAIWYLLALARGTANDKAGQVEALEKVVSLRPTDDGARWVSGVAYALHGDYDKAESDLNMVGEGPQLADAIAALGFVAKLEGVDETAQREFEKALETDGLNANIPTLEALGKLVMQQGLYQEAQQYFDEVLASNPNNNAIRYLRAVCMQARDRQRDAVDEFDALAKEGGQFSMEAGVQLAQGYLSMNMPDKARQAIERAGRNGGNGAPFHTVKGRVLSLEGDVTSALESFRKAVGADPLYAAAYLERGLLHVRSQSVRQGLRDLDKYLELIGDNTRGTRAGDIRALAEQLRQTNLNANRSSKASANTRRGGTS